MSRYSVPSPFIANIKTHLTPKYSSHQLIWRLWIWLTMSKNIQCTIKTSMWSTDASSAKKAKLSQCLSTGGNAPAFLTSALDRGEKWLCSRHGRTARDEIVARTDRTGGQMESRASLGTTVTKRKMFCLSQNPEVHHDAQKSQPLNCIMKHLNPVISL